MHDLNAIAESNYTNRACNSTSGKRRRRRTSSTCTKVLIVLTVVLLICTIALSAVLGVREATRPSPSEPQACTTMGCIEAAARIHSWIDNSTKPCDDFFQFACGSWMNKRIIPDEKSLLSTFSDLRDDMLVKVKRILESSVKTDDPKANEMIAKMRKFYQTCLARDSYGPPSALLHQIFSSIPLPYINATGWNDYGKPQFERFLADVANYGLFSVVTTGVNVDVRNTSHYIFGVDQPPLEIMARRYYLDKGYEDIRQAMKVLMDKILKKAYQDLNITTQNVDAEKLLQLQIDIANATVPLELRRDINVTDNRWTVRQLKESMSNFNWTNYLDQRMKISSKKLEDSDILVVSAPDYLAKVDNILAEGHKDTFGQLITFRLILQTIEALPKDYREIYADFAEKQRGSRGDDTRWKQCADKVKDVYFRDVISRIYSQEHFDQSSKTEALDMISYVRNAFYELLKVNTWMDPEVRDIAAVKARKMRSRIGYPEYVFNGTYLLEQYEEIPVTKNFISDLFQYNKIQSRKMLNYLGTTVDRDRWGSPSVVVNAFYSPSFNQIYFPMGILASPFFDKDYPKYLNYGGIGAVIGHEITHGFDDSGRQRDENGDFRPWWPQSTVKAFKEAAQCIVDQYSNYKAPITIQNITLNGKRTQGENIADNGGIKQSFEGYQEMIRKRGKEEMKLPGLPYTPNQLFFINYGQIWCSKMREKEWVQRILSGVHSPGMFRVIGTLSNMPAFQEAFKCQPGTDMYPQTQCSVW